MIALNHVWKLKWTCHLNTCFCQISKERFVNKFIAVWLFVKMSSHSYVFQIFLLFRFYTYYLFNKNLWQILPLLNVCLNLEFLSLFLVLLLLLSAMWNFQHYQVMKIQIMKVYFNNNIFESFLKGLYFFY